MAKNGENARKRQNVTIIQQNFSFKQQEVDELKKKLRVAEQQLDQLTEDLQIAQTDAMDLHDESTAEIEENIARIDETNRRVRANLDKDKAEEDAKQQREQYNQLTIKIEAVRQQKQIC